MTEDRAGASRLCRAGTAELVGADRSDGLLQIGDAGDEPCQFLAGDFIGGGIAGGDIGAVEVVEAAPGKPGIAGPDRDELRGDPFGSTSGNRVSS